MCRGDFTCFCQRFSSGIAYLSQPEDSDINFLCITDSTVPSVTNACLRGACETRNIDYFEIDPVGFPFDANDKAGTEDLVYRPAISPAAIRVEQFLCTKDCTTFYERSDGHFFSAFGGPEMFTANDIPIPRTFYVLSAARDDLDRSVEALGGYPVILKVLGSSGGIGVMRADSSPSLYSIVDYALAQGTTPILAAYVPASIHWRVIVVGDRAIAAYKNPEEPGDFRTYASIDIEDFQQDPVGIVAELAVAAVRCQRLEFGGVDVLEHPSGRVYVLEANFPCFFAQSQTVAGIDVAGTMVDHLIAKAKRQKANRPAPRPVD